jgi:hypothetical protein
MMEIASSWHGKYACGGQFLEEKTNVVSGFW